MHHYSHPNFVFKLYFHGRILNFKKFFVFLTISTYLFLYLESCKYQEIARDGICNDVANLLDCNFDFGDCCLMAINGTMCAHCE
jgi:hypothetical protein